MGVGTAVGTPWDFAEPGRVVALRDVLLVRACGLIVAAADRTSARGLAFVHRIVGAPHRLQNLATDVRSYAMARDPLTLRPRGS